MEPCYGRIYDTVQVGLHRGQASQQYSLYNRNGGRRQPVLVVVVAWGPLCSFLDIRLLQIVFLDFGDMWRLFRVF
jgi:hypothetical protein